MVLLGLPTFDNTGSMGYPPRWVDSILVTASHFLAGNREAELKPTTFSSLLLFNVFLFLEECLRRRKKKERERFECQASKENGV